MTHSRTTVAPITAPATISLPAALVAIAGAGATLLLLASLHVLSPEFDPSWRVVSEYANGRYRWVLSLMFASWAFGSWALAIAIWSQVHGIGGKIALLLLVASGIGEAMASVFDINHPLHDLAGMIGVGSLPIAAVMISMASWSDPDVGARTKRDALDCQPHLGEPRPHGGRLGRHDSRSRPSRWQDVPWHVRSFGMGKSAPGRDLLCVAHDGRLASNSIETEIVAVDVDHHDFVTTTR